MSHRRSGRTLTLLAVVLLWAQPAEPRPGDDGRTLLLTGLKLIDGTGAEPRSDVSIVIRDSLVTAISHGTPDEVPTGAEVVDATGLFAVPGLMDVHTHLATDPNAPNFADDVRAELRELLGRGITDVRDMAGDGRVLSDLGKRTAAGELPGPDIHFAALLAGPGYFDDPRIRAASVGVELGTAPWAHAVTEDTDLGALMVAIDAFGARGVKLYAELDPQLTARISDAAHEQGLEVWAHWVVAPGRTRALDVVRADVDVVSHAFMLMHDATPAQRESSTAILLAAGGEGLFEELRNHGTILDATLIAAAGLRAPPSWVTPSACAAEVTRIAHEAGVRIATGSDHPGDGTLPGIHLEYALLVDEASFTPLEVLEAATRISAEAIGIEETRGTIEVGKEATLLLLREDPSDSVAPLAEPAFVIKRGAIYSGPNLRAKDAPVERLVSLAENLAK